MKMKDGNVMEKDIEKFIKYLKEQKNYSKYTISTYEEDLIFLSKYLEKEGISYLDIDYSTIRLYFNYLDSFNLGIAGFNKFISNNRNGEEILPMYLKKPQAERQLEEKLKKLGE